MAIPTSSALAAAGSSTLTLEVRSVDDLTRLARVFHASGLFARNGNPDAQLAQCAVQLMAGMEAGFTPFASITGVYVVNGRPGFSAQLLAQAIKRHPDYDYRVLEKTDKVCRIRFLCRGEELGLETFTMEMAERAGLTKGGPWKQYPEAMLFARCLTAGMRTHCPDALGGHTAYTPEELGAQGQIDEDGMVTVTVTEQPRPMLTTVEDLVAGARRACEIRGLTTGGIAALCIEISDGRATKLEGLERTMLARLAKSGVTPETVARCNVIGSSVHEPEPEPNDDDDLPAAWAISDAAAAA